MLSRFYTLSTKRENTLRVCNPSFSIISKACESEFVRMTFISDASSEYYQMFEMKWGSQNGVKRGIFWKFTVRIDTLKKCIMEIIETFAILGDSLILIQPCNTNEKSEFVYDETLMLVVGGLLDNFMQQQFVYEIS